MFENTLIILFSFWLVGAIVFSILLSKDKELLKIKSVDEWTKAAINIFVAAMWVFLAIEVYIKMRRGKRK